VRADQVQVALGLGLEAAILVRPLGLPPGRRRALLLVYLADGQRPAGATSGKPPSSARRFTAALSAGPWSRPAMMASTT
jgi:hypothetical protein